jgi:hypothetical protein
MKRKFVALSLIFAILYLIPTSRYTVYDAISGATSSASSNSSSSSTSSNVDKSGTSMKKNKSNALKLTLDDGQEIKDEKLKSQIDRCFDAIKTINLAIKNKTGLDDTIVNMLIQENEQIKSGFTGKESVWIEHEIDRIDSITGKMEKFQEQDHAGKADRTLLENLRRDIDNLSSQYRAIRWKLYL